MKKPVSTIGDRIEELRRAKGMSQKQLAEILDLNPSTISQYEYDKHKLKVDNLINLAQIFGVTTDYLLAISDVYEPTDAKYKEVIYEDESGNKYTYGSICNILRKLNRDEIKDILVYLDAIQTCNYRISFEKKQKHQE